MMPSLHQPVLPDWSSLRKRLTDLRAAGVLLTMEDPVVPPAPTPPVPPAPSGAITPEVQAQIDRIVGDRLAQQREQYGMTPAEAKAAKAAADKATNDALTEQQRLQKERDDALTATTETTARAAAAEHRADMILALTAANVPGTRITQALKLLDIAPGADEAAVKAGIEKLKAEVPEFFTRPATPGAPGTPPGSPPGTNAMTNGAERARNHSTAPREYRFGEQVIKG